MTSSPRFSSWLSENRLRLAVLLREHTTLCVTLLYLLLTFIGATHEFFLYTRFRVNILQFAEPPDFLLAAIRQPLVVVFTVLPLALLWGLEILNRGLGAVFPGYRQRIEAQERRTDYRRLQRWIYPAFILIYFVFFTIKLSQYGADRLREGHGRRVTIRLNPPAPDLEGILLGTTSKYVFLYQRADSSTHVVPVESMVEMRMLARQRGR